MKYENSSKKMIKFTPLVDISNQIDMLKKQLATYDKKFDGLTNIFRTVNLSLLYSYIDGLLMDSEIKNIFADSLKAKSIEKLEDCGRIADLNSLGHYILWYACSLQVSGHSLSVFLKMKHEFELAFLWNNYKKCQDILDECNSLFGITLWEIKNRVAISEKNSEPSIEKIDVSDVLIKLRKTNIAQYIVQMFRAQYIGEVPVNWVKVFLKHNYKSDVEKFRSTDPDVFKFRLYCTNYYSNNIDEIHDILCDDTLSVFLINAYRFPVVDRFVFFCNIVSDVFLYGDAKLKLQFIPILKKLNRIIAVPLFSNVIKYYDKGYYPFFNNYINDVIKAYNLYTKGKYDETCQFVGELLKKDLVFFPMIEVYARSQIYSKKFDEGVGHSTLINTICNELIRLQKREDDYEQSLEQVESLVFPFSDTIWGREVLYYINRFNSHLMILQESQIPNYYTTISIPDQIFDFEIEKLDDYLSTVNKEYRESLCLKFCLAVRERNINDINSLPADPVRKSRYLAALYLENDSEEALSILERCCADYHLETHLRFEIDALRIEAFMALGKLREAIHLFMNDYFDNSNFAYIGPLGKLYEQVTLFHRDIEDDILTSCFCRVKSIYDSVLDDEMVFTSDMVSAYLINKNVDKPSDLLKNKQVDALSVASLYFFSEVCKIQTISFLRHCEEEDDALRERLFICEQLLQTNCNEKERIRREKREIEIELFVNHAKKTVEASRIYIGRDNIRSMALASLRNMYQQYSNLLKMQLRLAEKDDHVERGFIEFRDSMLKDMIRRIRDLYTNDNIYGLNICLSTRIRHSDLETEIRRCFKPNNLLVTRESGRFLRNNLCELVKNCPSEVEEDIERALQNFTVKVDSTIKEYQYQIIQIKTEDPNSVGLLDYSINQGMIDKVRPTFIDDEVVPIEYFVDNCISFLDDITNETLANIRNFFLEHGCMPFLEGLQELESLLEEKKRYIRKYPSILDNLTTARTQINEAFNTISGWFSESITNDIKDYSPKTAGLFVKNKLQYKGSLYINWNVEDDIILPGSTFSHMADIFTILFENTLTKSGQKELYFVDVSITRENENEVRIIVANPVSPEKCRKISIEKTNEKIKQWELSNDTSGEGGSGLLKIKKLISIDFDDRRNDLVVSKEDNKFIVEISIFIKKEA